MFTIIVEQIVRRILQGLKKLYFCPKTIDFFNISNYFFLSFLCHIYLAYKLVKSNRTQTKNKNHHQHRYFPHFAHRFVHFLRLTLLWLQNISAKWGEEWLYKIIQNQKLDQKFNYSYFTDQFVCLSPFVMTLKGKNNNTESTFWCVISEKLTQKRRESLNIDFAEMIAVFESVGDLFIFFLIMINFHVFYVHKISSQYSKWQFMSISFHLRA